MEKLPKKRKDLDASLSRYTPLENDQYLPQRQFENANSNISTSRLRSTNGKVNNQAFCNAEIKILSKKCYKVIIT